MSEELSGIKYDCEYLPNDELAKASDVIVVFGGDGTVLESLRTAQGTIAEFSQ